jgi:D-arabinose 1-dehydrogenase-like Zn-dependent alcohol dehydrogenase
MRAVVYDGFQEAPAVESVPDPSPAPHGAVVRVEATGLCRSDWHGWMGHDPDISRFPHVPGHELAGVVEAVGSDVERWRPGARVTVPFVCACGSCEQCAAGHGQICDRQTQPGFTHWGSFAELVALDWADVNLVGLPESVSDVAAAGLGCRFATAYRAVLQVGRARAGEWVAVHGCGGVGLSAVMIAAAAGARVVAIDVSPDALAAARAAGAEVAVEAGGDVRELTGGGAHVSLDAIGAEAACAASVAGLRKRGRHVQVGLLLDEERDVALPMDRVIAYELDLRGVHGMAVGRYDALLRLVTSGAVEPARLIGRTISLEEAGDELAAMGSFAQRGVTVIEP